MQLVVLEALLRLDIANAMLLAHRQHAVRHSPPRRRVVLRTYPFIQILSIEENNGIGGRLGGGAARRHWRVYLRILMLHLRLGLLRKNRYGEGHDSGDDKRFPSEGSHSYR